MSEQQPQTDDSSSDPLLDDGLWESHSRNQQREYVTIRNSGTIGPNKTVCDNYLEGYDAVILLYHRGEEIIGIRPIDEFDEDNDEHYRLRRPEDSGAVISGKTFLEVNGIKHKKTRRYEPEWHDELDMLILDPNESGEIVKTKSSS